MKKAIGLLLGASLMTIEASAQDSDNTYNTAKECRSIERDSRRLACYDSVIDGVPFTVEVRREIERKAFGQNTVRQKEEAKRDLDLPDEEKADQVTVSIISVTKLRTGRHIFITSDGQVWRQLNANHVAREKFPYKAVIKKGRMGSYSLVSKRYPKVIKVRRAK